MRGGGNTGARWCQLPARSAHAWAATTPGRPRPSAARLRVRGPKTREASSLRKRSRWLAARAPARRAAPRRTSATQGLDAARRPCGLSVSRARSYQPPPLSLPTRLEPPGRRPPRRAADRRPTPPRFSGRVSRFRFRRARRRDYPALSCVSTCVARRHGRTLARPPPAILSGSLPTPNTHVRTYSSKKRGNGKSTPKMRIDAAAPAANAPSERTVRATDARACASWLGRKDISPRQPERNGQRGVLRQAGSAANWDHFMGVRRATDVRGE